MALSALYVCSKLIPKLVISLHLFVLDFVLAGRHRPAGETAMLSRLAVAYFVTWIKENFMIFEPYNSLTKSPTDIRACIRV
jgi:hypothetical protein